MPDVANDRTEKIITEIERRINIEYAKAIRELNEKINGYKNGNEEVRGYWDRYEIKKKRWEQWVATGQKKQEDFLEWQRGQLAMGKRWEALRDALSEDLVNASKAAAKIAKGFLPDVYALNYNYGTYQVEQAGMVDTSFVLYSRDAAARILGKNPQMLPAPGRRVSQAIADGKARRWNNTKIQSVMLQAILQGESIPDISIRLRNAVDDLADSERKAATRNARTMVTGAQNAGRMDSYHRAMDMGIETEKQWIATMDMRTRHAHRELDGVVIPVDEYFENSAGPIMYPGDPDAAPDNVYNCFVGETKIAIDSDIVRSYKHDYSGKLITVKTACGVQFTCTPNHPILTPCGWVKAERLQKGNDLLVASVSDNNFLRIDPNINHAFPRIDAVHKFFNITGSKRTVSLGVNFHGDIPTSDVEIITQKRFLRDNRDSSFADSINKFLFKHSNKSLASKSTFMKHFRSIRFPTFCRIGSFYKMLSFFLGHVLHTIIHGFRTITWSNAVISQSQANNMTSNVQFFSNCLDGFAGKVFANNIVDIEIKTVSHIPVYNLQTNTNRYFVNSIISQEGEKHNGNFAIAHNCRCTLAAKVSGWTSMAASHRSLSALDDGMDYDDWVESHIERYNPILLPEEKADAIRAGYIREYRGYGGSVASGRRTDLGVDYDG